MSLDNRIVIAGGGRVGFQVANLLDEYGHTPFIIEPNTERVAEISESHISMIIEGDATSPEILTQANIEGSDAVAAMTGDGETNIAVCAQAREIAPGIQTVARADTATAAERETREEFIDAVVYPEHAGSRLVLTYVLGEDFQQFTAMPEGFEVVVFEAAENAPVDGKRVTDIALPVGSRLIADVSRSVIITNETRIEQGNQYMLVLDRGVADEVRRLFEG
ncbi:MAG: TrkA family potassium uptake protein [Halovenus sp.]